MSFMLSVETFEMRKHLLTFTLVKPRQTTEAILKTLKLFAYGDVQYITNVFRKKCAKIATP
jgi:hypothetical protein